MRLPLDRRANLQSLRAIAAPVSFPTVAPIGQSRSDGLASETDGPISKKMSEATAILAALERGEPDAADQLLVIVYDELRRLAAGKMAHEARGHTLQPTALVHEAWLRLVGAKNPKFENRAHFFAAAGEAMRRILIDIARRKRTRRHGGGSEWTNLEGKELAASDLDEQLLAVHEVLDLFAEQHPLPAEVVKLRYFVGMTNEETAKALDISVATVKNYWTFARTWISLEIKNLQSTVPPRRRRT
jgi:RNA polymerase sigma factor (TIGR02999 family)